MGRIVVVLGRDPAIDIRETIRDAWRGRTELVVLNLGFPLSPPQQEIVDAVLGAGDAVELDARICYDVHHVVASIHPKDRVVFATSPEERRDIEVAMGARSVGSAD